jgi:hypothetical protein
MMMNKTNETKVRNLVEGFLVKNDDIESFEEFMKEFYKDPDMMIDNLKWRVNGGIMKDEILPCGYVNACKQILEIVRYSNMNIKEIESLTYDEVKNIALDHMSINGHDCFFVDLGKYFGYSVLIFKNKKHIYYANDYQLHHPVTNIYQLKENYTKHLNESLFFDSDFLFPVSTYDEYQRKNNYLLNYYSQRYDHLSMYYCGFTPDKKKEAEFEKLKKEYKYFSTVCFCYFKNENIVTKLFKYKQILEDSFSEMKKTDDEFRKMIRKELANHEFCIMQDPTDTLGSLGLTRDELSYNQEMILQEEMKRNVEMYY